MPPRFLSAGLRRVLVNIAFITGANLFGRVLNLALHAGLGRMFGPEGLGGYATAVAISSYFMFTSDLGLSPRFVRECAFAPETLEDEYADAVGFKIGISFITAVILGFCLITLPYNRGVLELIALLGVASIVRSFSYLNESVCRSQERLDMEGAIGILNAVLVVGGSLALLSLGHPVEVVGWVSLAAAWVQLACSFWMASRFVRISVNMPDWRALGQATLPYATTSLTLLAFAQVDILVLSLMESQSFVGEYASVSRILLIVGMLGPLACAGILPAVARLFGRVAEAEFNAVVNQALRLALILGGAATLGLGFLAEPLIATIYGPDFAHLFPLIQLGSICMLFKFSSAILQTILTSVGRQTDRARAVLIGLFSTIILVPSLTKLFGLSGAVGAMVINDLVLVACFFGFLRDRIVWRSVSRTLLTIGIGGAGVILLNLKLGTTSDWFSWALSVFLPMAVFVAWVFVTGEGASVVKFAMHSARGGDIDTPTDTPVR